MRQLKTFGQKVAAVAAAVIATCGVAQADVASDKAAAMVLYPKISVDGDAGVDTTIRLSNASTSQPITAHCFYENANSYCSGGSSDGAVCTNSPSVCTGGGLCLPAWQETDFRIVLTPQQPIAWSASTGLQGKDLPIPRGVCVRNPGRACGTNADCEPFPGGTCSLSNAGTNIPPVADDPFVGNLRCIAIDPQTDTPVDRNDLKGEALVISTAGVLDVASYNAIGFPATGNAIGAPNELVIGPGAQGEYSGCPNYLIVNHFFDGATNPVPLGGGAAISTNLVFAPCSVDYLRQLPGNSVAQYLVFNEFEQRFSTSRTVRCFQDIGLSKIDTSNSSRSVWNVSVAGTLSGQTRINPIGVGAPGTVPSGLVAVAFESHGSSSAGVNVHMSGVRADADVITMP